jgi:hypothetical protein
VNDVELARQVDAHEARALADIVESMSPEVRERFGADVIEVEGATAILIKEANSAFFNRVIGLGVRRPATAAGLDRLLDFYAREEATVMVHLNPHAAPRGMADWLERAELEREPDWVTIARGDGPVGEVDLAGFTVKPVEPDQDELFAATLCAGYGMPDEWAPIWVGIVHSPRWMNWLLWESERAVATGSLFVEHGQARLSNGTTLPSHRGRGIHKGFLRYRIDAGLAAGCRLFTGETWRGGGDRVNPARRSHDRNEIREVYVRQNYLRRR